MDWHRRYLQQAQWTRELRAYLFGQAGVSAASNILEVGCGTGALLTEFNKATSLHGLDIDAGVLAQCQANAPTAFLVQGDALQLPYTGQSFEIVYCHFLLLWLRHPLQALLEMKRVCRPGAHIFAFAEPDYTARVDKPRELAPLGQWQAESLRRQGADPSLGARLADLFFTAGVRLIETGTLQSADNDLSPEDWETEWAVIESDLAGFVPDHEVKRMKKLDREARAHGKREMHVPTHFAWGRV